MPLPHGSHHAAPAWNLAATIPLLLALTSEAGIAPAYAQRRDPSGLEPARILHEHNRLRVAEGLEPLAASPVLQRIARDYALELARRQMIDHVGEDGSTLTDRAAKGGYLFTAIGENLAFGHQNVKSLMHDWMHSPSHRANILQPAYTQAGIGFARDTRGLLYVVVNFGAPRQPVTEGRVVSAHSASNPSDAGKPSPSPTALLKQAIDTLRAQEGAAPLTISPLLTRAAGLHAYDLAQRSLASPVGSDGATVSKRVRDLGYRPRIVAQLVARGGATAEEVITRWSESAGPRRLLLDDHKEIGLARVEDDQGVPHWCVVLADPQTPPSTAPRSTPESGFSAETVSPPHHP